MLAGRLPGRVYPFGGIESGGRECTRRYSHRCFSVYDRANHRGRWPMGLLIRRPSILSGEGNPYVSCSSAEYLRLLLLLPGNASWSMAQYFTRMVTSRWSGQIQGQGRVQDSGRGFIPSHCEDLLSPSRDSLCQYRKCFSASLWQHLINRSSSRLLG